MKRFDNRSQQFCLFLEVVVKLTNFLHCWRMIFFNLFLRSKKKIKINMVGVVISRCCHLLLWWNSNQHVHNFRLPLGLVGDSFQLGLKELYFNLLLSCLKLHFPD